MANPYAPKTKRTLREVGDPKALFLSRLARLGAPADVIEDARLAWDEVRDADDQADRDRVADLTDDELRNALRSVLDEWVHDTSTEDEQAGAELAAVLDVLEEARTYVEQTVAQARAWIGDDRARAAAVWVAEHDHPHDDRTTLLAACEAIAGDWLDRLGLR